GCGGSVQRRPRDAIRARRLSRDRGEGARAKGTGAMTKPGSRQRARARRRDAARATPKVAAAPPPPKEPAALSFEGHQPGRSWGVPKSSPPALTPFHRVRALPRRRSLTNVGGSVETSGDPAAAKILAHALDVTPSTEEEAVDRAHVHGF